MRHALSICLISALLAGSGAAFADAGGQERGVQKRTEDTVREGRELTERAIREGAEEAEKAIKEGVEKVMRALEMMFRSIPQYEAPEINKNGDIIIRRKRTPAPRKKPPVDDEDSAST